MQLTVIKADGTQEQYLHTKVLNCLANALASIDLSYVSTASELADTVTFYLYNQYDQSSISSGEIFSIILAVLSGTGYDNAAENLSDYHHKRNLARARLEISRFDTKKSFSSTKKLFQISDSAYPTTGWNKSKIVQDLQTEQKLDNATARIIASMVEEKILNSGIKIFTTDFIKFLVISQTQAIILAQQKLDLSAKAESSISKKINMATDGHLRQSQKGLCPVEV